MPIQKDKVFARKKKVGDFTFNESVADVFDDMLERSVPFYSESQKTIVDLVERFAKENTNVYDLGCSSGTTMLGIAKRLKSKGVKIIGIDNSEPMLQHARKKLKDNGCLDCCELKYGDLNQPVIFHNPSVVLSVLTLQFIRPLQREYLIKNIYERLPDNGCFILFEKILGNDSITNRLFIDFYYNFKKKKGYSQLEIAQKREALENVLVPYRLDENILLLRRNGFPVVDVFFKWCNFAGIIGIK